MYIGLLFHFEISQHRPYHKRGEEYRLNIVFHLNECLQVETDSKIQGCDMEFIFNLLFLVGRGENYYKSGHTLLTLCFYVLLCFCSVCT